MDNAAATVEALVVLGASLVMASGAWLLFHRVVLRFTARTETDLDDILAESLRRPVAASLAGAGTWYAIDRALPVGTTHYVLVGLLITALTLVWGAALARAAARLLDWLVQHRERYHTVVTARTLPVFDIGARTFIYGGCAYFVLLAWDVDVTGWLASAGIIGVAIGFASQDTLSNLIAGVFILADAPYKLGDYLVLDSGERGEVVDIGIRTTRLLTRDDVEIILPNKVMANARIVNQSGGPHEAFRVRIQVGVSYDVDIDRVHEILLDIANANEGVEKAPAPRVRFRAFGQSSLDHELLVWVARPVMRGLVSHQLHTAIHKRFRAEGIEIPFPQRVVHLERGE